MEESYKQKQQTDIIDLGLLAKKIWSKRRLFLYKVWPITFVISCLIILCVPRYYTSQAKLAPELGNSMSSSSLGSLASSFGINLGGLGENADAINPLLYPDLMEDNGFVANLFPIHVKSADGEIDTDYYTYLKKYQKVPWWSSVSRWLKNSISSLFPKKEESKGGLSSQDGKASPYWLSESDEGVVESVRGNINFNVDKQTAVITITATAQDPLVAKILTDSVQAHLQQFITDYRTNKARVDEKHYQQLYEQARVEYKKTCDEYATLADSYMNTVLNRYHMMIDNKEKDMQLQYTTLQTLATQYQVAHAKVQERTPAFTIIKGASVPQRPAGPKRMMFVLGMLILVTFIGMFWVVRKELHF